MYARSLTRKTVWFLCLITLLHISLHYKDPGDIVCTAHIRTGYGG